MYVVICPFWANVKSYYFVPSVSGKSAKLKIEAKNPKGEK